MGNATSVGILKLAVLCGSAAADRDPQVTGRQSRSSLSRGSATCLQTAQKAVSVRNRRAKIFRDGLSHVRERIAHTEIRGRAASRRIHQNRHILTRMVGG